jgi:hypothetical protein
MTAAAVPVAAADVNVEDITHLDFPPGCEFKDCDHEAAWIVRLKPVRPLPCCSATTLFCQQHLDGFISHIPHRPVVICQHLRVFGRLPEVLKRAEPL